MHWIADIRHANELKHDIRLAKDFEFVIIEFIDQI